MKKYKHYIIYKITNLINGKIYIGKHKCNYLDDTYFGSGKCLELAIKKYGIENFKFDLLIDLKNQTEMDLLEEMVVNKDFLARSDVYNISRGGVNPCMYGETNPFYGKRHTDEVKQKLSSIHAGVHISETHKKNISLGLKRLYQEHPEITMKFASLKNKKQCRNKETGEIKFFEVSKIPENFEIYRFPQKDRHVSEERKLEIKRNRKERVSRSNGITTESMKYFVFLKMFRRIINRVDFLL